MSSDKTYEQEMDELAARRAPSVQQQLDAQYGRGAQLPIGKLGLGRRRTGRTFTTEEANAIAAGEPLVRKVEPEPEYYIPQRAAKSVAEQLTGKPVRCRSVPGLLGKEIRVTFVAGKETVFEGATFWLALRALKSHLSRQNGFFAATQTPAEDDAGNADVPPGEAGVVGECAGDGHTDGSPHDALSPDGGSHPGQ